MCLRVLCKRALIVWSTMWQLAWFCGRPTLRTTTYIDLCGFSSGKQAIGSLVWASSSDCTHLCPCSESSLICWEVQMQEWHLQVSFSGMISPSPCHCSGSPEGTTNSCYKKCVSYRLTWDETVCSAAAFRAPGLNLLKKCTGLGLASRFAHGFLFRTATSVAGEIMWVFFNVLCHVVSTSIKRFLNCLEDQRGFKIFPPLRCEMDENEHCPARTRTPLKFEKEARYLRHQKCPRISSCPLVVTQGFLQALHKSFFNCLVSFWKVSQPCVWQLSSCHLENSLFWFGVGVCWIVRFRADLRQHPDIRCVSICLILGWYLLCCFVFVSTCSCRGGRKQVLKNHFGGKLVLADLCAALAATLSSCSANSHTSPFLRTTNSLNWVSPSAVL